MGSRRQAKFRLLPARDQLGPMQGGSYGSVSDTAEEGEAEGGAGFNGGEGCKKKGEKGGKK